MNTMFFNFKTAERNYHLLSALILFIYLAIAILLFQIRTVPFTGYETDGVYYMIQSQHLFSKSFTPPVYGGGMGMIFAIRLFRILTGDTFQAAKLVSAIAGFLYLLVSLRITKKLFSPVSALITGFLLLMNPYVLIYSSASLSDMLGAALPMLALWISVGSNKPSRFFLAGFFLGLAWAVRSINVTFWPIVFGLAIYSSKDRLSIVKALVLSGFGLILGGLAQIVTNILYFGNPLYTENWRNIVAALHGWDYAYRTNSFAGFLKNSWLLVIILWLKGFFARIPRGLFSTACYLPLLFAIPGYILALRNAKQRMSLMFWGAASALYLFALAPVWRIESRYFLLILPLVLASAASMWQILAVNNKKLFILGLVVVILLSAAASVEKINKFIATQGEEFKQAGLFLRERADREDLILASQPHVFFYARQPGCLYESLSKEEIDNLTRTVKTRDIAWIVLDERRGLKDFPGLSWLMDPRSSQAKQLGWNLACYIERPYRILIWKVNKKENF